MRTEIIVVTPEMAKKWLLENTGNRKIRMSHVRFLIDCLQRGEWIKTHQGIAFDNAGRLLDGQHRLTAISISGISAEMMVTFDADPDTFAAIDSGLKRSYAEILRIDKRVAEPLRLAARIVFPGSGRPTPNQLEEVGDTGLAEDLGELIEHCGSTRKFFTSAPMKLAAVMALWTGSQRSYVFSQYSALARFDVDSMADLARVFAKDVNDGKFRSVDQYAVLARGIRVFDQRRSESKRMRLNGNDVLDSVDMVRGVLLTSIEKRTTGVDPLFTVNTKRKRVASSLVS